MKIMHWKVDLLPPSLGIGGIRAAQPSIFSIREVPYRASTSLFFEVSCLLPQEGAHDLPPSGTEIRDVNSHFIVSLSSTPIVSNGGQVSRFPKRLTRSSSFGSSLRSAILIEVLTSAPNRVLWP